MRIVKGGITAPGGFLASAVNCGIKKNGRNDLALLYSKVPAVCVGVFTTNKMRSGSVILTERRLRRGVARALIVDSGNANCCVGKREMGDAEHITALISRGLDLKHTEALIASTGIIGRPLPVNKIKAGVGPLIKGLKKDNGTKFAQAITTTDTVCKELALRINIGGRPVTIAGAAKGSGMISPNMATMLAFFTTDASVDKGALRAAFKDSVDGSFNRITVDGDMSTNDTAIMFANGLAGNRTLKKGRSGYFRFSDALKFLSAELAKKIILDGEGATKFVEILVKGAKAANIADRIARHVADSNLIKTMIAGGDPNWGRVAASIGSSGVDIKKDRVNIYFGKKLVMKNGAGAGVSRKALRDIFRKKKIDIIIDLASGASSSRIWTCDLTEGYVKINAEYET